MSRGKPAFRSTDLCLLNSALCIFLFYGETEAKTHYKKWLNEEVVWIISQAERSQFEKLSDDEKREAFVEEFWRRRDPIPTTEPNEYKEEHYRRLLYATRAFQEGVPGWKTDRGRVYIIHGPPDGQYFFASLSTISPLRVVPSTKRTPNTIVWVYHQNRNARYYKGEIRLVFQPSSGLSRQSFVLGESRTAQEKAEELSRHFGPAADQTWLEADVRYQLIMAGPPAAITARGAELPTSGVGELAKYMEDIFRSPGETLEERSQEFARREKVRRELREAVGTVVSFGTFEFQLIHQAFYRSDGHWLVVVDARLPVSGLHPQGKLDIYGALLGEGEKIVDEFVDSVQINLDDLEGAPAAVLNYRNTFRIEPGEYLLRVLVRDAGGSLTSSREAPLLLKTASVSGVKLSSLLLTNRAEVHPEGADLATETHVVVNGTRLLPNLGGRFRNGEYLFVYLQIWAPQESAISLNANFIHNGEIVKSLSPRRIEDLHQGWADFAAVIPLEGFPIGEYVLQVQVLDHTSRKSAIQRASFVIE